MNQKVKYLTIKWFIQEVITQEELEHVVAPTRKRAEQLFPQPPQVVGSERFASQPSLIT